MTEPRPPSADEISQLRSTLIELRRLRLDTESKAERRGQVEAAIVAAERNADAVMTPELVELQRITTNMANELQEGWAATNRLRVHVAKLNAHGVFMDERGGMSAGPRILQAMDAESTARASIRRTLIEAEVQLLVPDPTPIQMEPHPNRDQIADMFDQVTDAARQRDAQRRRGRHPHKDPDDGAR